MPYIRRLQPFDFPRYTILGGLDRGNLAYTMDRMGKSPGTRVAFLDAARLSLLTQSRWSLAYFAADGARIMAIAAARRRSGPRVWEISHLDLSPDSYGAGEELLGQTCREVARRGGERVFVRLREDEPCAGAVRRGGFVQCSRETLFKGPRRLGARGGDLPLRRRRPHDDHNLFRLYMSAFPTQARLIYGVTFDQWSAALERSRGLTREFVYEADGEVRAWVTTSRWLTTGQISITVGPEESGTLAALVDFGMSKLGGVGTVRCLVPDHQPLLQRLLVHRGLDIAAEYVTMAKTMVAPVTKEAVRAAVPTPT